jgi:hypothetical protein
MSEEIIVKIIGDASGLSSELRKASGVLAGVKAEMSASLGGIAGAFANLTKVTAVAAAAVAAAGVGMAAYMTKNSMEAIDAHAKLADRLGLTTEALGGLQYAAHLSGAGTEQLGQSLTFMQRTLSAAAAGSQQQAGALREIGVSMADLKGLTPEQQFGKLADALNAIGNQSDRTRLQMEIFGRSGAELAPLLAEGSAGMEEAAKRAEELGLTFSRFDAAKVEGANDAVETLGKVVATAGNALAVELSPYIKAAAEQLTAMATEGDGVQGMMKSLVSFGVKAAGYLADAWQGFGIMWSGLKVGVAGLSVVLYSVVDSAARAGSWIVDRMDKVGQAIGASFWTMYATGNLAWVTLKSTITTIANGIKATIGLMLVGIGKALDYLPGSIGKTVENAGSEMVEAVGADTKRVALELAQAGSDTAAAYKEAGQKIAAVFTEGGDVDNAATGWTGRMLENSKAALSSMKEEFNTKLNQPIASDAIDQWLADAVAKADIAATEITKKVNDRLANNNGPGVEPEDKDRQKRQDKLDELRKSLMDEMELEEAAYQEKVATLNMMKDTDFADEQERWRIEEALYIDHLVKMGKLTEEEANKRKAAERQKWDTVISINNQTFGNLATLMDTKNKELFAIGKASAIAQATISTYAGAAKAFETVPYPFNFAAAASVIVAGMVQVANISSTSLGGGGGGGGASGGGVAVPIGSGADGVPFERGIGPNATPAQTINISIEGEFVSRDAVLKLIDQINDARRDGATIQAA